jgi:hypothetical protein
VSSGGRRLGCGEGMTHQNPSGSGMKDMIPSDFHLSQNYPDPFSSTTSIKFCVAYRSRVTLDIVHCETGGIQRIADEEKEAGTFEVEVDARRMPEGSYVCIYRAGDCVATKKMMLKR